MFKLKNSSRGPSVDKGLNPDDFDLEERGPFDPQIKQYIPLEGSSCYKLINNLFRLLEFQGVTVHVRECGEMKGGIYDIQDHCVQELTDKTTGYICACHTDGCNKGLGNSAKTAQLNSILLILAPLAAWLLYFK